MRILIILITITLVQTTNARGFYETTCYHNGEVYAHLLGDKSCPSYESTIQTPTGSCNVSHQGAPKGQFHTTSINNCMVANAATNPRHCSLTRSVQYNDPDL